MLADLRLPNAGRWEDGGPIIGPEPLEGRDDEVLNHARARADKLGVSTVIVVRGQRIEPSKIHWFQKSERGWQELPASEPILLAAAQKAVEGGRS